MVQKYLLAASSLPRYPPEFTKFLFGKSDGWCGFSMGYFMHYSDEPFFNSSLTVSEKHKKDISRRAKGLSMACFSNDAWHTQVDSC